MKGSQTLSSSHKILLWVTPSIILNSVNIIGYTKEQKICGKHMRLVVLVREIQIQTVHPVMMYGTVNVYYGSGVIVVK